MLNIEPSPQRERLGFKDAVLSNFKFLAEFGLRPVEKKATLVLYKSSQVFVNIYHGRASYELGVEIGRLKKPGEGELTISDIVAWAGAEKAEGFGYHVMFQVSSPEGVQEFVPKLARLVQKYATPFLKGDANAYREALEVRSRAAAERIKQVNLRQTRSKAETAWQGKNYAEVVELYNRVRDELSKVESKRLRYAERQIRSVEGADATGGPGPN